MSDGRNKLEDRARARTANDAARPVQINQFDNNGGVTLTAPVTKPSNPKDVIGVKKVSFSYVSAPVMAEVALGMMEGGFKYGRHNYREVGVRASIYYDAAFRHLTAFWEGEDYDPESGAGLHHISKAIASLTVLRDSMIRGNWDDDRPPKCVDGWQTPMNRKVEVLSKAFPVPVKPVRQDGK